MTKSEQVYQSLPDRFTRQNVLEKSKQFGLAYSTANALLSKFEYQAKAERIEPGTYRKLSTQKKAN